MQKSTVRQVYFRPFLLFPLPFPCCSPLSIRKREQQTENPPLETPPASFEVCSLRGLKSKLSLRAGRLRWPASTASTYMFDKCFDVW
jgi:hypothetical protein